MMAERQVVHKEAQDLIRTIDKLESYAENPMTTTFWYFAINTKRLINVKKVTKLLAKMVSFRK
jgi:DNA polymerase-3 subunit delta